VPEPLRLAVSDGRASLEDSELSEIRKSRSAPSRLGLYLLLLTGLVFTLVSGLWFGEIEPFRQLPIWGRGETPDLWRQIAFLLLAGGLVWVLVPRHEHASGTTIRKGLLGVGTIFVSTLIAGEWGLAASIVVLAILSGYYDSGKHRRQLESTVRRYGE